MILNQKKNYGFTKVGASNTNKIPSWDKFRFQKIKEIFRTSKTILDFGNSSRELSYLFKKELKGKKRLSVDITEDYNPDIVADICNLNMFKNSSIDGIICAAILEHVYNPFLAVSELHRVLKPGGKLFVYVPWIWKYHAPPTGEFKDYYRFSRDGIKYLFKEFNKVELCPIRGRIETMLNLISYFGKGSLFHRIFGDIIQKIDNYNDVNASGFNVFIVK